MRHQSIPFILAGTALLAVLGTAPARAQSLAVPGDRVLRQDVEFLVGYGLIPGPIDAWPMSWEHLAGSLETRPRNLPPEVEAAARRVLRERPGTVRLETAGALTSRRSLVFGFDGGARDRTDIRAGAEAAWRRTAGRLMLGYRAGDEGDRVVLDGSYVSVALGNWVVWGGAIDRWYGPGEDAGLVLSRNAKSMPGAGVFRSVPRSSDFWLLRWMGPWRFDAFAGVVTGDRNDVQNPLNLNMQLSFRPAHRFEVAVSRGLMICGEGRPCGLEEWVRAMFPLFDLDNQDTPGKQDPSNQVASVSFSYTMLSGNTQVTPMMEWYYEDEFNYISILLGTRVLAPVRDGTWRFRLEYSDTYANRILGILGSSWLDPTPTSTYTHFIYTDGYTYDGRDLGHSLSGDGKLITLGVGWVGRTGYDVLARLRHADVRLNPRSLETPVFSDTWVAELGGGVPLGPHRLGAALRWTEDPPFDPGGDSWEVEGSFRFRLDRPS